jgi:hypothetical protein
MLWRAVLIGLALLGAAGPSRAESISVFEPPRPAGLAAIDAMPWSGASSEAGACTSAPAQPDARTPPQVEDILRGRLPFPPLLLGPATRAEGGAGMGGNPRPTDPGGSGQHFGLSSGQPMPDVRTSGRLFVVYTRSLPRPSPADVFHPPRNPGDFRSF